MAKTVLIVDDVAFVRKTLAEILTAAHYEVVGEASDGLEAVTKYSELRPDLVTMDVVMPQMSGIEATRRILKSDKDARVVVISAMGQENLVMEAINVGARDYLLKPFSAADVLKTVERALLDGGTAAAARMGRSGESRAV
jgi:two-component system, chemotaxis family, chemotaxis protein CheY